MGARVRVGVSVGLSVFVGVSVDVWVRLGVGVWLWRYLLSRRYLFHLRKVVLA